MRLYLRCPRQFYYAYGEGIFQEETPSTLFGSYIHTVLEEYVKHLLKNQKNQDLEALFRIASNTKKEFEDIPENGALSFFEADVLLNKFASAKLDPNVIYGIEKFFKIQISEHEEIPIEGRIDRIDIEYSEDEDHTLHIIDYKSGRNKLTAEELKNDLQMKFYITGSYFLYKKLFNKFRFSLYYLLDNSIVSFETVYNERLGNDILDNIKLMKNDAVYDKKIGNHCNFCPAKAACRPYRKNP
jgi:ATP-dependent helicase/DNAse subunit B